MDASHQRRMRRALFTLAALLLSCIGLGAAAQAMPRAADRELAGAESRWATRSFGHYELRLTDKGCQQVIEVVNELVKDVLPNRCEPPPRSVTDLFRLIQRDGDVSTPCILLGCACDDVLAVSATYDAALGYPTEIEVRVAARPNWQHPDYWAELLEKRRAPNCSALPEGSKIIRIVSVTPLT